MGKLVQGVWPDEGERRLERWAGLALSPWEAGMGQLLAGSFACGPP